jgi:hypothetical protein
VLDLRPETAGRLQALSSTEAILDFSSLSGQLVREKAAAPGRRALRALRL